MESEVNLWKIVSSGITWNPSLWELGAILFFSHSMEFGICRLLQKLFRSFQGGFLRLISIDIRMNLISWYHLCSAVNFLFMIHLKKGISKIGVNFVYLFLEETTPIYQALRYNIKDCFVDFFQRLMDICTNKHVTKLHTSCIFGYNSP